MFGRVMSWPKLIGAAVGAVGVSGLVGMAPVAIMYDRAFFDPSVLVYLIVFLCFALLSFPLVRGHDWARRVTLGAVILIGIYFFQRPARELCRHHEFSGPAGPRDRWLVAEAVLHDLGDSLLMLTVPLFIVGVLCHPDVVSTFREDNAVRSKV